MSTHATEVAAGTRFEFGRNWQKFLESLSEERITQATQSLQTMLQVDHLRGRTFLDLGCGSGLFSLAALRLGASAVRSVDFDPQSVACAVEIKRRCANQAANWTIETGSVLDRGFLQSLGKWDVVYSWGVLHHTGAMWQAIDNVSSLVRPGGRLFIAIYNDQGAASARWHRIKLAYNRLPAGLQWTVVWPCALRLWGPTTVRDILRGKPFSTWRNYASTSTRGMAPWRDVTDWVGGLPFEVAKPEEILDFCTARRFVLKKLKTCGGGFGCNEFVFELPV